MLLLHLIFLRWGPGIIPAYGRMHRELGSAIRKFSGPGFIFLGLIGALAEEAVFRGALWDFTGPVLATLIFALLHFPVSKNLIAWPFFALAVGIPLAVLRHISGDIWSAFVLHGGINIISFFYLCKVKSNNSETCII